MQPDFLGMLPNSTAWKGVLPRTAFQAGTCLAKGERRKLDVDKHHTAVGLPAKNSARVGQSTSSFRLDARLWLN